MSTTTIEATIYIDITHGKDPDGSTEVQKVHVPEIKFGNVYMEMDQFYHSTGCKTGDILTAGHSEALANIVDRQVSNMV